MKSSRKEVQPIVIQARSRKTRRGKQEPGWTPEVELVVPSRLEEAESRPGITVLLRSAAGTAALRPGPHVGVCFDPHCVLRPFLQILQHVAGHVRRDVLHLVPLLVFTRRRLIGKRVADDVAVATVGWRSRPTHLDAGGGETEQMHFLRRGGRGWKG